MTCMTGWNIFVNRKNGERIASWSADIVGTPPAVKIGLDWISRTESKPHVYFGKSEQTIAACHTDEYLTIEIWDLS